LHSLLYLSQRTLVMRTGVSGLCRYCCKSPKLPGANFLAVKKSDRRPPIDVASITLRRSPVSLSSGDEVPHIFTRKSRLRPKEFLIASAKRLLQQNRPQADICSAAIKAFAEARFTRSPHHCDQGPTRPTARRWGGCIHEQDATSIVLASKNLVRTPLLHPR
jgi:hypothetical protein